MSRLLTTLVLLAFVQIPPFGGGDAFRTDLAARRAKTMAALGAETILVMWSAPTRVFSNDVDYEYHQDPNLFYLTGMTQEETTLVVVPGAKTKRAWLFVRAADPRRELWNGHVLTTVEASGISGIADVRTANEFAPFVEALLSGTAPSTAGTDADTEFADVLTSVRDGKAKLAILDRIGGGPGRQGSGAAAAAPEPPPAGSHVAWAVSMQQKHPGVAVTSAAQVLTTQRQLKTPYEQQLLRRSVEISAEAHIEGMRAAKPGRWEYEVEAAIEHWYLRNGAMSWGYPSIVASGPNATTLHYEASTRQMQEGDLLLVDAAANYQGLTGDITRTYPVNGRFTRAQRDIYDLVLAAQEAGIAAVTRGGRAADITAATRSVFAKGLLALGLITESTAGPAQNQQVSLWFPHGPTHGIGLDVHDPLGTFEPGAAFTIEPGLYIRQDTLDNLPKTPENAAFIEKVRPAVEKYRQIGVRIEDSFLFTDSGLVNLSARTPRKPEEIEKIVGKAK
jgi:Xaa-Pro aminopeptidase